MSCGKTIGQKTYLHVDCIDLLPYDQQSRIATAQQLADVQKETHFNVIRLDLDGPGIALLAYSNFFEDPFPALKESWLVDLDQKSVRHRNYAESSNPPILHRKELLLPQEHPRREEYAALTAAAKSRWNTRSTRRIS